jgi:hypothetical protein
LAREQRRAAPHVRCCSARKHPRMVASALEVQFQRAWSLGICGQLIDQLIGLGVGAYHKTDVSGWGLTAKQMSGNETSSSVSDRNCTNILEASPRAMPMPILWKLLNTDRSTLSPFARKVKLPCGECHERHRLVRGSDSNDCVPSRLGAPLCTSSTALPLQHLLTSQQHVWTSWNAGHPPLHVQ